MMIATIQNPGVVDMVVKIVLFLILLATGGYAFVTIAKKSKLSRSCRANGANMDSIDVISMRHLSGRTYLVAVEHFGRRFLLAVSDGKVEKISEWNVADKSSCLPCDDTVDTGR